MVLRTGGVGWNVVGIVPVVSELMMGIWTRSYRTLNSKLLKCQQGHCGLGLQLKNNEIRMWAVFVNAIAKERCSSIHRFLKELVNIL